MIRRDAEVRAYQQKQWDAEAAKIARLRALRLARDTEENAQRRANPDKAAHAKRGKAQRPTDAPKNPGSVAAGSSADKP